MDPGSQGSRSGNLRFPGSPNVRDDRRGERHKLLILCSRQQAAYGKSGPWMDEGFPNFTVQYPTHMRRSLVYHRGHAWIVFTDFGLVAGIRDRGQGPVERRAHGPLSVGSLA